MINSSYATATSSTGGLQIVRATGEYFCAQCLLSFENDKEYKVHYKSEIHLYNIKRRLLDLIPATPEQFDLKKKQILDQQKSKLSAAQATKTGALATVVSTKATGYVEEYKCFPCNKSFASDNTYRTHVISKKHKECVLAVENKQTQKETEENAAAAPKQEVATTDKDQTVCLFCDYKSKDIETNLVHMRKSHSFFVSEEKYCVNVKGLLKHLGKKINSVQLCIQCENKGCKQFFTADAVKRHMADKNHFFMQTEVFDEYAKYYDFSAQIEEELEYQKTLKNRENLFEEEIQFVQNKKEGDAEEDGEEWESDVEGEDNEEEGDNQGKDKDNKKETIPEEQEDDEMNLEKETKQPKKQKKATEGDWEDETDEEKGSGTQKKHKKYRIQRIKIAKAKVNERGELELPNGKTLGHRSLKHIYNQYYRPISNYSSRMKSILGDTCFRERQLVLASNNFQVNLVLKYNAMQKHKEERNLLATQFHRNKINYVNIGLSHNKLQHHFRDANPL